jgi:hypothetical protein
MKVIYYKLLRRLRSQILMSISIFFFFFSFSWVLHPVASVNVTSFWVRHHCSGIYLSHPVPEGYKYGDLALENKPQGLELPEGLSKFKNSPHWVSNPRPSGL